MTVGEQREIETEAMSRHLDNLETMLQLIRQRPRMTIDQRERYARLLAAGERDAIDRLHGHR